MTKFKKSQILMLSLIAALLILAPLLSTSLRPTYLYFVLNLLIIALGAEAGLLSFFSKASEPKLTRNLEDYGERTKVTAITSEGFPEKDGGTISREKKAKVVEKCASEKTVEVVKVQKVKKCPSTPSLFFIGSVENEAEEVSEDENNEEEEESEVPNGQELFNKAETFIGNFYKQLKMQRENSWKRIHGLYHKAF